MKNFSRNFVANLGSGTLTLANGDIGKVSDIGSKGFLSNNGYVFCSPIKPGLGIDYNCVGEFLETDSNNNYYLFKINLQL